MSISVPPDAWAVLQQYLSDGKSGQIVWEVRGGEVVAVAFTQKIRFQGGADMDGPLELKLATRG